MGKSAPAAPDYTAAAAQQGAESRLNTEQQTWANRPTINTPWGQQSWGSTPVYDPATDQYLNQWEMNVNLSPDQQAALDQQMAIQGARSGMAANLIGNAQQEMGTPLDWNGLPQRAGALQGTDQYRQNAEDALYRRQTSRLDPMWQQKEQDLQTQLYNRGYREGDAGFSRAQGDLGRARTDAYQQAMDQSIIGGRAEAQGMQGMDIAGGGYQNQQRQAALAEAMQRQGWSLNQMNAALSGQQVAMPNMPSFNTAQSAQPTQYLQAAQMQGQSNLDQFNAQNAQMQGLMGGAAALAPYAFSDERLKRNVVRYKHAEVAPGVPFATWEWADTGEVGAGVIAQDVEAVYPDLVKTHENGYKMVNYEALLGRAA
jgi:hypothetical protein